MTPSTRSPHRALLAAMLVAALAACSSGDAVSVEGTWHFKWTALNGSIQGNTYSCSADLTFAISQTDATFSGFQTGLGSLTCGVNGTATTNPVAAENLVAGTISAQTVSFALNSVFGDNTGTITGNTMSGDATWSLAFGDNQVTLVGTWTATRV
jgi:flagellar biosynthesis protein FliR